MSDGDPADSPSSPIDRDPSHAAAAAAARESATPATPVLHRTFDNPLHEPGSADLPADHAQLSSAGTTVTGHPPTPRESTWEVQGVDDRTPAGSRPGECVGKEEEEEEEEEATRSVFSPGTTRVVHTARKELRSAAAALAEAKAELFNVTSGGTASPACVRGAGGEDDPVTPLPIKRLGVGPGDGAFTPPSAVNTPKSMGTHQRDAHRRAPDEAARTATGMDAGTARAHRTEPTTRPVGTTPGTHLGPPSPSPLGTSMSGARPPPPPPPPPSRGRPTPAARPPPPPLSPKPATRPAAHARDPPCGDAAGSEPRGSSASTSTAVPTPAASKSATGEGEVAKEGGRENEQPSESGNADDTRPTDLEISEYAQYLGLVPGIDGELLWIAEQALMAPIPEGWRISEDHLGRAFYINTETGESSWEHPFDEDYRDLANRMRPVLSVEGGVSPPKESDVLAMAAYFGIDPSVEPRLLWIASQASVAPLPEGWAELEDDSGEPYYYDAVADASTRQHPLDEMFRAVLAMERSRVDGRAGASLCSRANCGSDMGRALMRLTSEEGSEEMVYDWVARKRAAPEQPDRPGVGGTGETAGVRDGDVRNVTSGDPRESASLVTDVAGTGQSGDIGGEVEGSGSMPWGAEGSSAVKMARMPLVSRVQGAGVRGSGAGATGGSKNPMSPRKGLAGVIKKKGATGAVPKKHGALAVIFSPFQFANWLLSLLRALLVHDVLRVPRPHDRTSALTASIR